MTAMKKLRAGKPECGRRCRNEKKAGITTPAKAPTGDIERAAQQLSAAGCRRRLRRTPTTHSLG
jgi:hypothetical protein